MPIRRGYKLVRFRFLRALRMVRQNCPAECAEAMDFTVNETRNLLDHGEEGIGLEILISNLFEVSYPVSEELLAELRWLANECQIASSYARILDRLQP